VAVLDVSVPVTVTVTVIAAVAVAVTVSVDVVVMAVGAFLAGCEMVMMVAGMDTGTLDETASSLFAAVAVAADAVAAVGGYFSRGR
jgi:hypothetical protein